ncbi:hypothetical protein KKD84_03150, partial [Patescibacteria group bacterium]|nr:hypothetical protein [Patescibacteria group bacterium]
MLKQKGQSILLVVIITAVVTAIIVGTGIYSWQKITVKDLALSQPEIIDTGETTQGIPVQETEETAEPETVPIKLVDSPISGAIIEESYHYRHGEPDGFRSIITGGLTWMNRQAIAELYGNKEVIESFYSPEHPTDKNILFISTSDALSAHFADLQKNINRIYTYNIESGELTKIYEEQNPLLLRTMGIEGSKLILMYDGADNSPGPCYSTWYNNKENFVYLELADIENGLVSYVVPQYKLDEGEEEINE